MFKNINLGYTLAFITVVVATTLLDFSLVATAGALWVLLLLMVFGNFNRECEESKEDDK